MEINSKMHLGSTFNSEKYHELEKEAQEEYDANNKKSKGRRLQMNKFSFRATVWKIVSVTKSFMSWIGKRQEPHQHPDSMDFSQEYVNAPTISSEIVPKAVKNNDGKLELEHIPIEKGHVHRMTILLEPHFKGQKDFTEKLDNEQCSRFAGNPMTTQVNPPSSAVVEDWNYPKTKLVQQSLEKSLSVSNPSAPSDKLTEENFLCSEVTRPSSSQAAVGCEENRTPSNDDERGEPNTSRITSCAHSKDRQPLYHYYHHLPEMEQVPPIERGLVSRLAKQIETQLQRNSLDGQIGGPPLYLKSSSLASSSDGSNECDEKGNRPRRRGEHYMKVAEAAQSHSDNRVSMKAKHASTDEKNGSLIVDDQVKDDHVAIRLQLRRERILKSLEACSGN